MEIGTLISWAIAGSTAVAAFLAYFKFKPGQRETLEVSNAQANLLMANSTITMVKNELESQFRRMVEEQSVMRREMAELRGEVARLHEQLEEVTSERDTARRENRVLRARVVELEKWKAAVEAEHV